MKRTFWIIAFSMFWTFGNAQSYYFATVYSPVGCAYTYEISIVVRMDSVKVTNIYFDDGTNGSFAFEAYFSYQNVFVNSTLPAGNFFTYDISLFTTNPAITPNVLTNDIGTVPIQTGGAGGFSSLNNPTYNTSATRLALVSGGVYSDPVILRDLLYDSATIHINLPCLDTVLETNDTGTLPVLWSDPTASVNGDEVSLSWETYMEQNNLGFSVERSLEGANWRQVSFIGSKAPGGNSDQTLSYLFKQTESFGGKYFYRIIQKDLDGRYVVSNTVTVELYNQSNANVLKVYPNPTLDAIYLRQLPSNTRYMITDINGRVVLQGNYRDRIDVSILRPGLYLIQINGKVSRFVVL